MTIQAQTIDAKALATLRARMGGALLRPGEEGYDEARRVWNGASDRRPELVARCAGTDEVLEAVRFAREQEELAGRAPGQVEGVSPSTRLSGLGRTPCAS